mmetsp:Transcript_16954/g.59270  ORF Transcript_16954/g.59270 Transcript_16954/m.59270 type:complete len:322 (+) Transcript_16954:1534-2499(+)
MRLQGAFVLGTAQITALALIRGHEHLLEGLCEDRAVVLHGDHPFLVLVLLRQREGVVDDARDKAQHREEAHQDVEHDGEADDRSWDHLCQDPGNVVPARQGHDAQQGLHGLPHGPEPSLDLLGIVAPHVRLLTDQCRQQARKHEVDDEDNDADPNHRGEGHREAPGQGPQLAADPEEPHDAQHARHAQQGHQVEGRGRDIRPHEEEGHTDIEDAQQDQKSIEEIPAVLTEATVAELAEPEEPLQREEGDEDELRCGVGAFFEVCGALLQVQTLLQIDILVELLLQPLLQLRLQQRILLNASLQPRLDAVLRGAAGGHEVQV